jgi:DNA-directed RNA polymerase specialized sigma subunit
MVVRLWFWEEMTAREIAEAMRIFPEHRVYTLLRAALARLREHAEQTYRQQRSSSASVYNQQKEA